MEIGDGEEQRWKSVTVKYGDGNRQWNSATVKIDNGEEPFFRSVKVRSEFGKKLNDMCHM
jgi:hypothetical protein